MDGISLLKIVIVRSLVFKDISLKIHTEGWDQQSGKFDSIYWVIHDIEFYYDLYWNKGENLYDYITRYEYDKEEFWKTTDGRYYKTLFDHIEELYNTIKLREEV